LSYPGLRVLADSKSQTASTVEFSGLTDQALYHAEIWAHGHRAVCAKGYGDSTINLPIPVDPHGVVSVSWPERVPEDVTAIWADLSDVERACLLNIRAKLVASALWE